MPDLKLFFLCTALATFLPSVPAIAESLEEEEKWNNQMSYMDGYIKVDREVCGLTDEKAWSFSFDKPSFSKADGADWSGHSPNGYCSAIFDELATICRNSESGKKRVVEKVKGVVCKFGGKGKQSVELKNGIITYTIDWDATATSRTQALKKIL